MKIFEKEQYVCEVCGFNIIGYYPSRCPFCGASNENFITAKECSEKYIVIEKCPSTFNSKVKPMDFLLFTHHHFIAAANLYKEYFGAEMLIHINDSRNYIADKYEFEQKFEFDFTLHNIDAYHIDGHTSGFTMYIYEKTLFICDYVFVGGSFYKFNPYGPYERTREGSKKLLNIISNKNIEYVCGYDYSLDYGNWFEKFKKLINKNS
ncbi:MAG: MBL fold metallo-hydrolase [Candidatus Lokiarchaeota archaeon]